MQRLRPVGARPSDLANSARHHPDHRQKDQKANAQQCHSRRTVLDQILVALGHRRIDRLSVQPETRCRKKSAQRDRDVHDANYAEC